MLKTLADSLNNIGNHIPEREYIDFVDSMYFNEVVWSKTEFKQHEKYEKDFEEIKYKTTTLDELEQKMHLLNGTRVFDELRYELIPKDSSIIDVKIKASKASRGSLAAGINYNNVYGGNVLLNLTLRNIVGGRGKLYTDLVLGQNPRLNSMFIINNGDKPGFGLEADLYSMNFLEYSKGVSYHITLLMFFT